MRPHLFATTLFLSFATFTATAATLDANLIAQLHEKVKTSFIMKCKTEMAGANDAICNCLADKAQSNLNDSELSKCNNDSTGVTCVAKVVAAASAQALSQENINACVAAKN